MTHDEAALYRAVLTNPADDAPRLVYADWLDERGDRRGEYLRLDLELSKCASEDIPDLEFRRINELRYRINSDWLTEISVGPSGWVKRLVYDSSEPPYDQLTQNVPTWPQVERGFNHVRWLMHSGWLLGAESDGQWDGEDFLNVLGGEGPGGEALYYVGGKLRGDIRAPLFLPGHGELKIGRRTQQGYRLQVFGPALRAVKWAYYTGTFWPGLIGLERLKA
jgi:uncharacterized protein (TIGR02996 family)